MPTIGTFHTFYWENTGGAAPPAPGDVPPGFYPGWQTSVTMMNCGLPLTPMLIAGWHRLVRLWRTVARVSRLQGEPFDILLRTLDRLEDPALPLAGSCVRKTATTLGFNRPEAWRDLSHALKHSPGDAENTFRHLEALRLLHANVLDRQLTNPEAHFLIELAYQGFAARGR